MAACILLLWGCSPMEKKRDDPLIGRIYESGLKREISYQDLLHKIETADVVYLGENHDNADHHGIQLRILRDLLRAGKRPQIGFELFSSDQTGYLMAFARTKPKKETDKHLRLRERSLRQKLNWTGQNDQFWSYYFRLIALARENGLRVFGTDLPKGITKRIVGWGIESLTPVEKDWIRSTGFDDPVYKKMMLAKFADSHCGFSSPKMAERMYRTWIARNDAMARAIVSMISDEGRPIVMIVGGGHTQHDMGLFERVAHLAPKAVQINVGLQEIALSPLKLQDYLDPVKVGDRTFPPSHAYLWFTRRNSYEDPCEKFKEHLKRMKRKPHTP